MRQRVGFARAIVVEPDALLMDEPFSALDVLTAENLRSELVGLWEGNEAPVKSIMIVTHNIEEAVLLADRILVLSSNPGRIQAELRVDLPRPRNRQDPRFESLVDTVYGILTGRAATPATQAAEPAARVTTTPITVPLPRASVGGLAGLLEIVLAMGGEEGLAEIADELNFEVDDLLPLVDAAVLLGLATTSGGRLAITEAGREFTAADILTSKQLFAQMAARRAPLVRAIVQALAATEDHKLREDLFLDLLRRGFELSDARLQLETAIDWGRYGELYDYDADDAEFLLEPGAEAHL
jgi:NitT/TauT family transport system ATP-binding protein